MDKLRLSELVEFFKKIEIEEIDATSAEENALGQLVVVVVYKYEGKVFRTKKLYYRNINQQRDVKDAQYINQYFGAPVYWLDIEKHNWPKGSGEAEVEQTIISEMIDGGDLEFELFLKSIADNSKSGFLQQLTKEGRRNTYGFNLENNNHWHDLILLIKEIIRQKGETVDKKYYSRLVFEWDKGRGRTSLCPYFGNRAIISHLADNIKLLKMDSLKMEAIDLLKHKHQIILQGPPGTGKTRLSKQIANSLCGNEGEQKIIQFHPAYSYEDFVRSITAKPAGMQIEYISENRILADFAQKAYKNLKNSQKDSKELTREAWIRDLFEKFKDDISDFIDEKEFYILNKSVSIVAVEDDAFRYTGSVWKNEFRMKFEDILQLSQNDVTTRQGIKQQNYTSGLARTHASYFKIILDKFRIFTEETPRQSETSITEIKKNFVIIIDEINRANLPAVLGELIYALEYRDEAVESMYEVNGSREIILPSNLYIIGTMNTADRSVGHIDYAIRRRFAFINVPPSPAVIDEVVKDEVLRAKAKALFEEVGKLFTDGSLASDFEAEDVQLGHSYFLAQSEDELRLKLKYEIKPLLMEYLKDGILQGKAKDGILHGEVKEKIESLHV